MAEGRTFYHEKLTLKDFRQRLSAGSFPQYPDLAEVMKGLRVAGKKPPGKETTCPFDKESLRKTVPLEFRRLPMIRLTLK